MRDGVLASPSFICRHPLARPVFRPGSFTKWGCAELPLPPEVVCPSRCTGSIAFRSSGAVPPGGMSLLVIDAEGKNLAPIKAARKRGWELSFGRPPHVCPSHLFHKAWRVAKGL
eukprot:5872947-Pleurochrysis_carterae.AAC.2